jgi:hypothetical protein
MKVSHKLSAVYLLKLNKTSIIYLWNNTKSAERGDILEGTELEFYNGKTEVVLWI